MPEPTIKPLDETTAASPDIVAENIAKLRELFPECFTEGSDENGPRFKVDFEALKETLGDYVEDKEERYSFTWNGKARARRIAQTPSTGTLRPCPDESVNWDTTQNLFIEGDNLEVLKLLQKSYHRRVKMIYIDPPYNTGKEFIYPDKFQENLDTYLRYTGQIDDEGFKLSANSDTSGRYHTNWLNMMLPRLKLARNLLADNGVLFVSIDGHEVHNLKRLCDDVFGEENYIETIVWNKRIPKNDAGIGSIHEYVLLYAKCAALKHEFTMPKEGLAEIEALRMNLKRRQTPIPEAEDEVRKLYSKKGYDRGITLYNSLDVNYELWGKINVSWPNADTFGPRYDVLHPKSGVPVSVPDRGWRWKRESFEDKLDYENCVELHDGSYVCGEIWFGADESTQPSLVKRLKDVENLLLRSIISLKSDGGIEVERLFGGKSYFSYPKPVSLIRLLINSVPMEPGDIVLDFFAGSASTAQAVLALNHDDGVLRRYVMVQLPEPCPEDSAAMKNGYESVCDIARDRVKRAVNALGLSGDGDPGFRAYKLDSSNIKPWDADFDQLEETVYQAGESIKADRSQQDILYELLLKFGLDLCVPIEERTIGGKAVYSVGAGALVICLDEAITLDVVEGIAALKNELAPEVMRVVFRDSGFKDDVVKTNAVQILKQAGLSGEHIRSI